jgi:methionyl-tRNA synthetase
MHIQTNRLLAFHEVWRKTKDPDDKAQREVQTIVYYGAESLRICGILLQPFMPSKMERLLDMLGVEKERRLYRNARFGTDSDYGVPKCDLGNGADDSLFPPLTAEW